MESRVPMPWIRYTSGTRDAFLATNWPIVSPTFGTREVHDILEPVYRALIVFTPQFFESKGRDCIVYLLASRAWCLQYEAQIH